MSRAIAEYPRRLRRSLATMTGELRRLWQHERRALAGHHVALMERIAVARSASGVGELIRDQVDLVPESRRRFQRDHQVRRSILAAMLNALRPAADVRA